MPEPISVPLRVSQAAAGESTTEAYKVPAGKKFHLQEVEVVFEAGAEAYLSLEVRHGIRRVAPQERAWAIPAIRFVARCDYWFYSGESVNVWTKNTHAATTYSAAVQLEGELTGGGI